MKRLVTALVLLALSFALCFLSDYAVSHQAQRLTEQLEQMQAFLSSDCVEEAKKQAESCAALWENGCFSFFVYLDHDTFAELEYLFPALPDLLATDKQHTAVEICRGIAVLKDMTEHQKLRLGNVL